MYIDKNGYKFQNIFLVTKGDELGDELNKYYCKGWYFEDKGGLFNGPFDSLQEVRKELRLYTDRLTKNEMNYNTFSSYAFYKTLGYITDKVNEMDKFNRTKVSRYFNSLNKTCVFLKQIQVLFTICDMIGKVFFKKEVENNLNYIQELVTRDYNEKISMIFEGFDLKFISYLKNFTKAKIRRLK